MQLDVANRTSPRHQDSQFESEKTALCDGSAQHLGADDLRARLELLQRQLKASQVHERDLHRLFDECAPGRTRIKVSSHLAISFTEAAERGCRNV